MSPFSLTCFCHRILLQQQEKKPSGLMAHFRKTKICFEIISENDRFYSVVCGMAKMTKSAIFALLQLK